MVDSVKLFENKMMTISFVPGLANDYKAGVYLGDGSHGTAIKSTRLSDNTEFAIKSTTLKPDCEKLIYGQLVSTELIKTHPHENVVSQVGAFLDLENKKIFEVMELCNGGDGYAKDNWPVNEALVICYQAAKGLSHLHSLGIMHRDIKMDNIFIHQENGKTIYKIGDFSCACVKDDESDPAGAFELRSPEMNNNQLYTNKTDVWSLGVTVYFLIFGVDDLFSFCNLTDVEIENKLSKIQENNVKELLRGMIKRDPVARMSMNDVIKKIQEMNSVVYKSFDVPEKIKDLKVKYGNCCSGRGFAKLSDSFNHTYYSLAKDGNIQKIDLKKKTSASKKIFENENSEYCSIVLNQSEKTLLATGFGYPDIYAFDSETWDKKEAGGKTTWGKINTWDPKKIWKETHTDNLSRITFLDNDCFCAGYGDGLLKKFKLQSEKELSKMETFQSFIASFHIDDNSNQLYAGNDNGQLFSIDWKEFKNVDWSIKVHEDRINFIAKYMNVIATGSDDQTVSIIDVLAKTKIQTLKIGADVMQMAYISGGAYLIVMSFSKLMLYKRENYQLLDTKEYENHFKDNHLRSFALVDNNTLLVGDSDGYIFKVVILQ